MGKTVLSKVPSPSIQFQQQFKAADSLIFKKPFFDNYEIGTWLAGGILLNDEREYCIMDKFAVWGELQGVEVRGVTQEVDLGRVQQVGKNYVLTEKGSVSKEKFYIPKYLVEGYDGRKL
jgi:hypothetical protein